MERFADAQVTLSEIDDIETKPFAAYRLSQSRLGQGDPSEALSLINAALDRLEPKHAHFRSAFLAHRFDVRQALSDTKAIEDLDEAIFVCEPGKYRDMLAGKRASLT